MLQNVNKKIYLNVNEIKLTNLLTDYYCYLFKQLFQTTDFMYTKQ